MLPERHAAALERDRSVGNPTPFFGKAKPSLFPLRVVAELGLLHAIARAPGAKLSDPHRESRVDFLAPLTKPR